MLISPDTKASCALLAEIVLSRCETLAAHTDQPGQTTRTFLSPAMEACNGQVRVWMEAAGMRVELDTAGNIHGIYDGLNQASPRLIIASHLDTVPNAGKYDGILGVLLGIALVESLAGQRLSFGIEVIGFSDEEGVRFGLPFIGSRAFVGALMQEHLAQLDANGITLQTALANYAHTHPEAFAPTLDLHARAYLEFHIEQGPVLDDAAQQLAVVNAIAGQSRASVVFHGQAGHAGTTPMPLRHDALTAAAEWLLAVETLAGNTAELVATTGRIDCVPNIANIIPGFVHCTLDVRSASDGIRIAAVEQLCATAQSIAARRHIQATFTMQYEQTTVHLDSSLATLTGRAMREADLPAPRMVSGAGHDAMIIAPYLPTAMIFLRTPGGLSHHPAEAVLAQDITSAIQAGQNFIAAFPGWLAEKEMR